MLDNGWDGWDGWSGVHWEIPAEGKGWRVRIEAVGRRRGGSGQEECNGLLMGFFRI